MRKESKIKSLDDLRLEIAHLKTLARAQEDYLNDQYQLFNEKIAAPVRFVKSLASWVPGVDLAKGLFTKGNKDEDWLSKALRIGLPVILNRFFLRKAGFIKRALVTLLSQQAAGALNKDTVTNLIGKVADFVRPSAKRRKKPKHPDYGIPPDSETY
ncbi:hypothetical protein GCM10007415_07600 [Parapedobacter pyrenivorans]|uniref:Uncharacterized protein n=1 Tax=Parapedobacter pyrenivorans TaxID=1305674 RepID=A0A917HGR7_9SPHI|nr:hypothetical protein [Parapedobacter pyrenivorans]GGG78076.1 hypothetical protein GCM10007415_07600 [Parapedobacter pyrenivorans]